MVSWNPGPFPQDLILPNSRDGASRGQRTLLIGAQLRTGPGSGGQLEGREGGRQPSVPSAPSWTLPAGPGSQLLTCEDLFPPLVYAGDETNLGLGRGPTDCTLPKARSQWTLQHWGTNMGWSREELPVGGRPDASQ